MLAKIYSGATVGLSGVLIEVEIDIASQGLPALNFVGLPSKATEEAKERVRSAIKNSGADFPARRITVNLAPADLPKEGPNFDLPIALGILVASGQIKIQDLSDSLFCGELSLDGSLRHTAGILPLALLTKHEKIQNLFIPASNAKEAAVVSGISVYPVENLIQLFRHLTGVENINPLPTIPFESLFDNTPAEFDFSEVQGQESAKRALEIAAAGGHNVFLRGLPGSGKTMLSRAFPGILPQLTEDEALEITKIYSITGNLPDGQSVIWHRPFRSPHHTTSRIGLIGGGSKPMPGEISLAHRGVIFMDEFPEYPRNVLEALRQPMEDGVVTISRAAGTVSYPAQFMLIAASNPCPCGYYGSDTKNCSCLPGQIVRYQKRISGPIMDRIDIHLEIPQVKVENLISATSTDAESSESIRIRVQKARDIQIKRFKNTKIKCNAEMGTKQIKEFAPLDTESQRILKTATQQLNLSARSFYKVIKIARTIADIAGDEDIKYSHVSEALIFRPKETTSLL